MSEDSGPANANVVSLFPEKPSLFGSQDKKEKMVELLERLLQEVVTGKVTGLAIVAFLGPEEFKCGTSGVMRYTAALGGLEDLKYQILKQGPSYK